MNVHKLIAVALVALLITAGAAAATPGASPTNDGTQTADEHQPDEAGDDAADADETDADENETDVEDAAAAEAEDDESEERDENASEAPPTDMPEPVPDHVSTIHELIRDKLNGDLGNTTLGEAISDVVGSDGNEAESRSDSAGEPSENADEAGENDRAENAGSHVAGDLPQQAADHVSAIHDAITAFLNGDGDNPDDEVSSAASG